MEAGGSGGGGGTLSEIYHSAQRLLLRATGGLERLERLDSSSPSSYSSYASSSSLVPSVEDPGELATEIRRDIAQIRSLCAEMKHLWRSVPSRGQRDLWKRYEIQIARQFCPMVPIVRVFLLVDPFSSLDSPSSSLAIGLTQTAHAKVECTVSCRLSKEQLKSCSRHNSEQLVDMSSSKKVEVVAEKVDSLKESLDKQLFRQQNRMLELEDRERAEFPGGANSGSAHVLRIFDEEAQAMQSARNSSMMLEEAYTTGVAVLSKYADQRDLLKRAQRKALDILNTVGLSNTVLKLIERRHSIDKWITYSGMGISFMVALAFVWSLH
ncbi:hypothetical protein ZIOFF_055506 [Zingiber officinale]|uniref:Membrin n=1 Tax=Zingiber officinale TaxID=94328 RepID=A0A8J5FHL4_ZINOF|nr:hypothetical protein ZIOFF_055506 [Zingiber officinale]